jgi:histidyl-tRNA synthetase
MVGVPCVQALSLRTVDELEALLGADNEAVADLRRLFTLAEAHGYAGWLLFDASVVRGLAYYTGAGGEAEVHTL